FGKLFIPADFEGLEQMGFQTAGMPHPLYHRFVDAQRIGQGPYAPVRRIGWLGLGGLLNDQRGHLFSLCGLSAAPWKVLFNPRQALLDKPAAPARDLPAVNPQTVSDGFVLFS